MTRCLRMLVLTRYGDLGASSRLRYAQFSPYFASMGICIERQALFDDSTLARRYSTGRQYGLLGVLECYFRRIKALLRCKMFDLIWIEKEALPWMPFSIEWALLKYAPVVIDFDDAVFHNYDLNSNRLIRLFLGSRIDRLMAKAKLITAGNKYLAERAHRAGAAWVEVVPTVVDLERYGIYSAGQLPGPLRLVWIGSPTSVQYLLEITPALMKLSAIHPFVLRVIGGGQIEIPGLQLECFEWSEDTEVSQLKECHVGIMPLRDTPWERGKCAYKLIQYMASELPTVASAVGANCEVVIDGETGFLVSTENQWVERLVCLLNDPLLRQTMGRAGHFRASVHYSMQVMAPRWVKLLQGVGEA
jgi:glycosyltransferase involved in cell wall biosynthesis